MSSSSAQSSIQVSQTSKFSVWSSGDEKIKKDSDKENKEIFLTNNTKNLKRITSIDVTAVAIKNFYVNLEIEFENVQTNEKPFNCEVFLEDFKNNSSNKTDFLPVEVCRASLFTKLTSLLFVEQSKITSGLLISLSKLLNKKIIPALRIDTPGSDLLLALIGYESSWFYTEKGLLQSNSLTSKISLSELEASLILNDSFLFSGVGSLLSSAAVNASAIVDCVSAFSCEAIGFNCNDAFDPTLFETSRPQRGQINSSSSLKMLTEGSKRVNLTAGKEIKRVFEEIPQTNGPVADYISIAAKAIEIELNVAVAGSSENNSTSLVNFYPQEAQLAIKSLYSAVLCLSQASQERLICLQDQSLDKVLPQLNEIKRKNKGSVDIIVDAIQAIKSLNNNLISEISFSFSKLDEKNESGQRGLNGKGDDDEDDEDGKEDKKRKTGPEGARKKAIDINNDNTLTPAQKAKIEAKQKAKAEKKAQKQAKKSNTLPLGTGTELIRQGLHQLIQQNKDIDCKFVDLFSLQSQIGSLEDDFVSFCNKLIESLVVGGKRKPKIAKGARDFTPEQMKVREQAFDVIRRVFKRHGAVEIDTPVFELKEVLTGKYGEDSKLIYNLADQGGELLSLRYDLTVPFARYLAMNSPGNIKRYHIAKVYRRDQPQVTRGRYREFYQCDFDIAGNFSPMVADAEAISVAAEILAELPVGSFLIKLNHRKLLDAIFEISGVPADKFRQICSAVDKLDKLPWSEVKEEMVNEKGLSEAVADRIGEFVLQAGEPRVMLQKLISTKLFGDHVAANEALSDFGLLFDYLEGMGSLQYVSLDLSLARGLDYYTGVVYEAILTGGENQVGSIAGGGRYDNLVGMFSASNTQIPCVGVSIGIERVFTIVEKLAKEQKILHTSNVEVYVASIGDNLTAQRMKVTKVLWDANIPSEFAHQEKPKFVKQQQEVLDRGIPFMVLFGKDEITRGTVKVKDVKLHDETEMRLDEVVSFLRSRGCKSVPLSDQYFMKALKANENK